jgi:hypothetical protein
MGLDFMMYVYGGDILEILAQTIRHRDLFVPPDLIPLVKPLIWHIAGNYLVGGNTSCTEVGFEGPRPPLVRLS